jgi:hypothetical protein
LFLLLTGLTFFGLTINTFKLFGKIKEASNTFSNLNKLSNEEKSKLIEEREELEKEHRQLL